MIESKIFIEYEVYFGCRDIKMYFLELVRCEIIFVLFSFRKQYIGEYIVYCKVSVSFLIKFGFVDV